MIYPALLGPEPLFTLCRAAYLSHWGVFGMYGFAGANLTTPCLFKTAKCAKQWGHWQPSDAAAVPAHLAIRACRRTSCPGSGLCQGRRSRPGRRGRRRLPPSTLPRNRSTPSQWSSSHDSRRGLSSCWDMYSPCEGGNREEPGFRIQTLNKTSGTPYIGWVTSAFVSAAPQLSPGLEIKYATHPLQTAYGVVIGIVIPHRVVRRLPRHLSLISGGPLHSSSVELHAEVTGRHKVTTGTEEQMVNTGNLQ